MYHPCNNGMLIKGIIHATMVCSWHVQAHVRLHARVGGGVYAIPCICMEAWVCDPAWPEDLWDSRL